MTSHQYATSWRQAVERPVGLLPKLRGSIREAYLSTQALLPRRSETAFLRGLYCHYVFDDQQEAFARLIDALTQMGSFVDTTTLMKMLGGEQAIDGRYFHLSFDDGFRNVFTNAVPILQRYQIPALVFVPTDFIGASWDVARKYCIDIARYRAVIEMMTWDDLRELMAVGIEVGSHTRSHARLSDISGDPAKMEDEIMGSKEELESRLSYECKYISWPFGSVNDADQRSLAVTKQAGYEACFGAFRGSVMPGHTDPYAIPRHHFEAQWPVSHVRYFAEGNWGK